MDGWMEQMDRQGRPHRWTDGCTLINYILFIFQEQKVSKQLMKCLQDYTTATNASYNEVKNDVIDFVQDTVSYISI